MANEEAVKDELKHKNQLVTVINKITFYKQHENMLYKLNSILC